MVIRIYLLVVRLGYIHRGDLNSFGLGVGGSESFTFGADDLAGAGKREGSSRARFRPNAVRGDRKYVILYAARKHRPLAIRKHQIAGGGQ